MKIVYVTFLYEPELGGGAAQVVYSLAHSMVNQGHEVTVITSAPVKRPTYEDDNRIKIVRFFPKNLYWVVDKDGQPPIKKIVWQLIDIWNPTVYFAVKKILVDESPDWVHVHKLRGLSPAVWSAAKVANVPKLAHTCHDYELISPEGQLSTRVGRLAEKRVLPMRMYQLARAYFSRDVEQFSGPSKYVVEAHLKMGFFPRSIHRVIPNSHGFTEVELEKMRMVSKHPPCLPLRLLYLGRLVPEKGIEELCDAVKIVSQTFPEIKLDVVGWGFLERKLRTKFGDFPNIFFHGAIYGSEKANLLEKCDVLVLPSLYPESFGIVLAEALAHGKPVLASRIGAIPEIIQDGETGFLFSPGDMEDLKKKILQIASDTGKLLDMRTACFNAAVQYSLDSIQQQYQDFYDE